MVRVPVWTGGDRRHGMWNVEDPESDSALRSQTVADPYIRWWKRRMCTASPVATEWVDYTGSAPANLGAILDTNIGACVDVGETSSVRTNQGCLHSWQRVAVNIFSG